MYRLNILLRDHAISLEKIKFYLIIILGEGGMEIQDSEEVYLRDDSVKPKCSIDFTDDVVIIDDDQDDRARVSELILAMNAEQNIRFFKNGEEFSNCIEGQSVFWNGDLRLGLPKVIFIDMHMPIQDGVKTLSIIRSNANWCDVPVILITGTNDDHKIQQAYELGANAFLSKPFRKIDLIQALYRGLNYTSVSI